MSDKVSDFARAGVDDMYYLADVAKKNELPELLVDCDIQLNEEELTRLRVAVDNERPGRQRKRPKRLADETLFQYGPAGAYTSA